MSIQWKWMIRLSVFLLFFGVCGLLHSGTTYAASKNASAEGQVNQLAQISRVFGKITDMDGFPVKDANVNIKMYTFENSEIATKTIKTNSKGEYNFETTLSEGIRINISTVAKGYLDTNKNYISYYLIPGETREFNFSLYEPATVVGKVTDQSGKPVVGAVIKVTTVSQSVKTDKDGNYAITGINPYSAPDIVVSVDADGYVPYTKYLFLYTGVTEKLNITLQEAAKVSGLVQDEQGRPLAGATVSINNLKMITDKQGKYSMDRLSPGISIISVEADGYINQTIRVTLVKGPNNTFDFILKSNADKTPPVTKYALVPLTEISNGKQYINGFNFKLKATDEVKGSGLKMTQYRINGGEWITFTGPIKIYAPDVKTVEYFSTDIAGNQEKINKMDFVNGKYEGAGSYPY
ncbi:carboxypeptidase regulatory-like domain-containing protein [Paenibacillus taichungensis]|uniref:Carboxypeptidase regulatory-like domain-containing protein n=1 Tax=Paenibacillus taichungensis TaxID=484184 RepID=A0ABX2MH78_9BACL|nr:carboxypeptidase-like regulatory domain-containing protein [Paenibacillus taichungensis]NUU54049.1 carboxypeptidase regulatory-like domain-containing protein [Paenibacillus taichungensis]